ncbi:MAG TPA: SIR2 family protein [Pyrinomonadaceae bacterium]|jgi:hypothetical protein
MANTEIQEQESLKAQEPESLNDDDWKNLLKQISRGKCTPFIGTEACAGLYEMKTDRAKRWADEEDFPLEDRSDLARVAQFLAVRDREAKPIDKLIEEFEAITPPNFKDALEAHRALAELPLPIYITTNYDDFMKQAFKSLRMPRDVRREYCRWRKNRLPTEASIFSSDYQPSVANPVVFHMYGHTDIPASLVLTENDFLKFLVNVSSDQSLIPSLIQGAIAGGSLLFLGYRLDEWDFRILFHTVASYLENSLTQAHFIVMVVPVGENAPQGRKEKAIKYLNLYFEKQNTRIYWGTCQKFIRELKTRWENSSYAK